MPMGPLHNPRILNVACSYFDEVDTHSQGLHIFSHLFFYTSMLQVDTLSNNL